MSFTLLASSWILALLLILLLVKGVCRPKLTYDVICSVLSVLVRLFWTCEKV